MARFSPQPSGNMVVSLDWPVTCRGRPRDKCATND